MILIFSDFGVIGPYSGAMRAVVHRNAPDITVCDLMVDAPAFLPRAAAYLLPVVVAPLPEKTAFPTTSPPGAVSIRS